MTGKSLDISGSGGPLGFPHREEVRTEPADVRAEKRSEAQRAILRQMARTPGGTTLYYALTQAGYHPQAILACIRHGDLVRVNTYAIAITPSGKAALAKSNPENPK